jgi:hypothetical protein
MYNTTWGINNFSYNWMDTKHIVLGIVMGNYTKHMSFAIWPTPLS